jgi:hypothetical protein
LRGRCGNWRHRRRSEGRRGNRVGSRRERVLPGFGRNTIAARRRARGSFGATERGRRVSINKRRRRGGFRESVRFRSRNGDGSRERRSSWSGRRRGRSGGSRFVGRRRSRFAGFGELLADRRRERFVRVIGHFLFSLLFQIVQQALLFSFPFQMFLDSSRS